MQSLWRKRINDRRPIEAVQNKGFVEFVEFLVINDLVFHCYKKRKTKLLSGQIIQKKELITGKKYKRI